MVGYVSAWKEGNHLELFKKICINNIKLYLQQNYDVIFNYIITPSFLKDLKEEFKEYDFKFVVLMAEEKQLLERDSQRPKDCQMKERCKILLNNFKKYNYEKKNILDTTFLSIQDSVSTILKSDRFKT